MQISIRTFDVTHWPSVLRKAAMAVSGLGLAVWLTLHMLGNLTLFRGAEQMNAYGAQLGSSGLLWPMRAILVTLMVIHVVCAISTSLQALRARPRAYKVAARRRATTWAARSMRATGGLLFAYVVYHVTQMYGFHYPGYVSGDIHHNLVRVLISPVQASLYLAATVLVTFHLAHGLGSSLISLGFIAQKRERLVRRSLAVWASVVTAGFAVEALAPLFGVVS